MEELFEFLFYKYFCALVKNYDGLVYIFNVDTQEESWLDFSYKKVSNEDFITQY